MPRPKPKPGKNPLNPQGFNAERPSWKGIDPVVREAHDQRIEQYAAHLAKPETQEAIAAAREAVPPWGDEIEHIPIEQPKVSTNFKKLKAARTKVLKLGDAVRDEAFDDWVRRCVVMAEQPREWTQASVLYSSYLRQAKDYGFNRGDKRLAKEELATETRWGRMMGSVFPTKRRRRNGFYYPVRLKRGA